MKLINFFALGELRDLDIDIPVLWTDFSLIIVIVSSVFWVQLLQHSLKEFSQLSVLVCVREDTHQGSEKKTPPTA